ncbi:hypothetical protein SAMN05216228_100983 [Rhizobium tibeticum]|uniref:Uncharacterized protein n=1 Tax=Rhizobium tibeticum TaxID=501024 RepID=A0A1H8KLQ7_9HYPH|nr:hypothetical protein [Rhizobium tibeticum]SEH82074.1 hypothetical protein RTCCBAU85039_2536 [Rhizobium tibeticum]SEN93516.1 hypothetical protein SAMN05216228_100983 [Rhizobium tibeticum]
MSYTGRFVGIDISKSSFDICILPEQQSLTFANTAAGIAAFIAFLAPVEGIERLILERPEAGERLAFKDSR